MIHYHGTPLTPREMLYRLAGKHLCVSFAEPRDAEVAQHIAQSVLWDNGAFSLHTKGTEIDEAGLYRWLEPRLGHPHRAVCLDRIDGNADDQREMLKRWPFPRELSWPVWHLDKPLDYLIELADGWSGLCLGSAGAYWQIGTDKWQRRMDEAFNALSRRRVMPWVHGLRMMGMGAGRWPLSSADSVNVARNYAGQPSRDNPAQCPEMMARAIDSTQPPLRWSARPVQGILVA